MSGDEGLIAGDGWGRMGMNGGGDGWGESRLRVQAEGRKKGWDDLKTGGSHVIGT